MRRQSGGTPIPCITPGTCFDNFGQERLACPGTNYAGEPLEVAENMCPVALAKQFAMRRRTSHAAQLRAAWSAVELGLSYGTSLPEQAGKSFDEAENTIQRLTYGTANSQKQVEPRSIDPANRLSIYALRSFLPAFRARTQPDNVFGGEDCSQLYLGLAKTIGTLSIRERERANGHLAEIEFVALLARLGRADRLAYMASPREEKQSGVRKRWNHDVYVLAPRRKGKLEKRAIQIKLSHLDKSTVPTEDREFYLVYRFDILDPAGVNRDETLADAIIGDAYGVAQPNDQEKLEVASSLALAFVEKRLRARRHRIMTANGRN